MNEAPVALSPARAPARPVLVQEAQRPAAQAKEQPQFVVPSEQKAADRFEEIAQKSHAENPRKALAGVAGWEIMNNVDVKIGQMHDEVIKLQKSELITEERAVQFLGRIAKLSQRVQEVATPRIQVLDEIALAEEKAGVKGDPFHRDLNLHMIRSDIKALEQERILRTDQL